MKKVIRPGKVPIYNGKHYNLFCSIEYKNGRMSMYGVIGPKSNGNCYGGAGQIDMEFAHRNPADDDRRYSDPIKPDQIQFATGWDSDTWLTFLDYWHEYHSNDMQAGCEHQRAEKWGKKELTIETWRLKSEVWQEQDRIKRVYQERLLQGEQVQMTPEERAICDFSWEIKLPGAELGDRTAWLTDHYELKWTEKKTSGWVTQAEHPDGVLSKPCPVCGYKYGSTWLKKEVPQEVIDWLFNLPDADITPAWV